MAKHNKTAFILLLFTVFIATLYFLSLYNQPDYTGYNTQQGVATIRFNVRPTPTPTPTQGGGGSGGGYYRETQYEKQQIQQPETQQANPIQQQEPQYEYPAARQIREYQQEPTVQAVQINYTKTKFPWWQTILAIIILLATSYLLMRTPEKKTA